MPHLHEIEILTFDCYGTLIDWEAGIRDALEHLIVQTDFAATPDDLLGPWEAIQFEMINQPWRPYKAILRDSLRGVFADHGRPLDEFQADTLAARIGTWGPFPDTVASLERLGTKYRLGILSNIDDDILSQSVEAIGVPFDVLVTAEQVQRYKPATDHFEEAIRRFDAPPDRFLHCAFGFKYDQRPAQQVGMRSCWVKRAGWIRDDDGVTPTIEVSSLEALCDILDV